MNTDIATNASGTATFAVGIDCKTNLNDLALTVGGNAITITSSEKYPDAGHIYNIERSAAAAGPKAAADATTEDIGKVIGADGKIYDDPSAALAASTTAAAMIGYVGSGTGFTHGLAIALTEEGTMARESAISTAAAHTPAVSGGTWRLLTDLDIQYILKGCGCCNSNPSHFTEDGEYFSFTFDLSKLQNKLTAVGGTTFGKGSSNKYWVDYMAYGNYSYFYFGDNGYTYSITDSSSNTFRARAVLAF